VSQLDLITGEPADPKLTLRQGIAYAHVKAGSPVSADEVGALLHSGREKHGADLRCDWCQVDGHQVLEELERKGLVEKRGGQWTCPDTPGSDSQGHSSGPASPSGLTSGRATPSVESLPGVPYDPATGEGIPY
jgi:hypothetical protein